MATCGLWRLLVVLGDCESAGEAMATREDFVGVESIGTTTCGAHATVLMIEVDDDFVARDEFVGVLGRK